jgi:hypothetical protein
MLTLSRLPIGEHGKLSNALTPCVTFERCTSMVELRFMAMNILKKSGESSIVRGIFRLQLPPMPDTSRQEAVKSMPVHSSQAGKK